MCNRRQRATGATRPMRRNSTQFDASRDLSAQTTRPAESFFRERS
jgi:hypothetical protein